MSKSRSSLLCLAERPLDFFLFSFRFRWVKYSRTTALRCRWSSRACWLIRGMLRFRKALTKALARWAPGCCLGTRRCGAALAGATQAPGPSHTHPTAGGHLRWPTCLPTEAHTASCWPSVCQPSWPEVKATFKCQLVTATQITSDSNFLLYFFEVS